MTTYAQRKAAGQCVQCGTGVDPQVSVAHCAGCLAPRRRRGRLAQRVRADAARLAPGPNQLGCCGAFHVIPRLPYRLPCCGRVVALEGT